MEASENLIQYWEVKNVTDTAFKEGRLEGKVEGIIEGEKIGIEKGQLEKALQIAKGMLDEKLPLELIVKLTGLSISEIEKLDVPFLNDEEK